MGVRVRGNRSWALLGCAVHQVVFARGFIVGHNHRLVVTEHQMIRLRAIALWCIKRWLACWLQGRLRYAKTE